MDVQASPAAELEPSGESTAGREAETEQITDGQEDVDLDDQSDALDDSVGGIEQGVDEAADDEGGAVAMSRPAVVGDGAAAGDGGAAVMNQIPKKPTVRTTWNCRQARRSSS